LRVAAASRLSVDKKGGEQGNSQRKEELHSRREGPILAQPKEDRLSRVGLRCVCTNDLLSRTMECKENDVDHSCQDRQARNGNPDSLVNCEGSLTSAVFAPQALFAVKHDNVIGYPPFASLPLVFPFGLAMTSRS
jgi:hypothetical protein